MNIDNLKEQPIYRVSVPYKELTKQSKHVHTFELVKLVEGDNQKKKKCTQCGITILAF